jgi:signal peptidase I
LRKKKLTIVLIVVVALFGAGFLVTWLFLIRFVRVPVGAMSNTIIPGDHLAVRKWLFGDLERGQIVVFQYPGDDTYYLSRVVGLPGESIAFKDRTIYINHRILKEQKVLSRETGEYEPLDEISTEGNGPYRVFYQPQLEEPYDDRTKFATHAEFRIPNDSFFMMSDNRDNSMDSRYRGPVPRNLVWGTPFLIYVSTSGPAQEVRWERVLKRID